MWLSSPDQTTQGFILPRNAGAVYYKFTRSPRYSKSATCDRQTQLSEQHANYTSVDSLHGNAQQWEASPAVITAVEML